GLGPVYDGIGHTIMSGEQLLLVAGLGLLAGLNGAASGRCLLFGGPCAWFGGGCLAIVTRAALPGGFLPIALLTIGALVAADLKSPRAVVVVVGGTACLYQGCLNGASFGDSAAPLLQLLGSASAVFVVLAFSAGAAVHRTGWQRIVVRVGGSWI